MMELSQVQVSMAAGTCSTVGVNIYPLRDQMDPVHNNICTSLHVVFTSTFIR
jgi:hypothetical protein